MIRSTWQEKFLKLRSEFPVFIFEKFDYGISERGIDISFSFNLSDRYRFTPTLFVPRRSFFLPDDVIRKNLPALAFNVGMVELISYWKAACPPTVIIRPSVLSASQVSWWKKLYFNGLGEFFYLNSISTDLDSFLQIEVDADQKLAFGPVQLSDRILIPVGGGKDSAVTLELLGNRERSIPLILNPRPASIESIRARGFAADDFFEIRRTIDPVLLTLNQQGFLNGHTPFSALLAFQTVLASHVTGYRHIALSNESSSNEPTIPGTSINHQYSKSFEFEKDFREYVSAWINPGINYFSFLRPLHELQIAKLFAGFPAYHKVFKSCNAGSKTDSWCCQCPKCLFTYLILSPFLKQEKLREIFGTNIFENGQLTGILDQLTGAASEKPFDCIGTIGEVNLAMNKFIRDSGSAEMTALPRHYMANGQFRADSEPAFRDALLHFSTNHFLLPEFESLLRKSIYGAADPE